MNIFQRAIFELKWGYHQRIAEFYLRKSKKYAENSDDLGFEESHKKTNYHIGKMEELLAQMKYLYNGA